MGCDIHFFVEHRKDKDSPWVYAPRPTREQDRDPYYAKRAAENPNDEHYERWSWQWYGGRNYRLFGALADVRNGSGFAGVDMGNSVPVIALPRGMPHDLSVHLARVWTNQNLDYEDPRYDDDLDWLGDHSFTWLTLQELLDYPWDDGTERRGVVSFEQWQNRLAVHGDALPLVTDESPYDGWSGGISGPNIVVYEAKQVLSGVTAPADARVHVRDRWVTPMRKQCQDFVERTIPAMQQLGDPENVRCVFGFDS